MKMLEPKDEIDYERKRLDYLKDQEKKLRDVEADEVKRLNKDIDAFQKELSLMLEREKMVLNF
jgi:hypothetical protein